MRRPLPSRRRRRHPTGIDSRLRSVRSLVRCAAWVSAEGRGDFETDPATLVLADSASFDEAERMLIDGIALAFDAAPELAGDLLPHVALFAVLHADLAARLGSASVGSSPGWF